MTADPPDPELVRRTLGGDREAFAALYDRHAGLVRTIAAGPAAADVVQETFLRAFRSLRTLRDPARFAAWLAGIARQVVREGRRRPPPGALPDGVPARPGPSADDADEAAHLLALVARLPADEREAVRLFFLCGRAAAETAKALARSRSVTYAVLNRAVGRLAGWLGVRRPERTR
jgi:RNA polymerase sigma-70 factor (ECF subfamily)